MSVSRSYFTELNFTVALVFYTVSCISSWCVVAVSVSNVCSAEDRRSLFRNKRKIPKPRNTKTRNRMPDRAIVLARY